MSKSPVRILIAALAIFASLALATACGDDSTSKSTAAPAATSGGGTPAVSNAAPSGSVTFRAVQFETWDPHFSDFSQDIGHFFMVWRGLYQLDLKDIPQPSMAAAAPVITDGGKTITVKLKPGLKWSDGQPLDANDFVLGVQRTCNPDVAGHYEFILTALVGCDAYAKSGGNPKANPPVPAKSAAEQDALLKAMGVHAVDSLTIEYKLTDPQATFPIFLALWPTFPVPKHLVKNVGDKWPAPMQNAYNGPFKPSEWVEKDHMTLVPNDNYAGGQKAQLEKITLKYIEDPAVALNAYRNNEIDATDVPSTQLGAVRNDPALKKELIDYAATRTTGLEPNLKDPLMAKLEVRLALSQATDRKTLNDVVLNGANVPSTTWMPPARSGTKSDAYDAAIGFDAAKAKDNLAKAGYPNGQGFPKLVLLQTETATNKAIGEFLQAEWKKHLGITIELEYTDTPTRSSRFNSGNFQLVLGGWGEDFPDPENWILGLYETGGSINKQSCSNPDIDKLIAQAKYDQKDEERRGLYRDIEKLVVTTICGQGPMWQVGKHNVVKPNIKGMIENKKPDDHFVPGDHFPELWVVAKK